MKIIRAVEFDEDEVTTINKFKKIIEKMSKETDISAGSIIFYLLDCSENEIKGKHDLYDLEAFY